MRRTSLVITITPLEGTPMFIGRVQVGWEPKRRGFVISVHYKEWDVSYEEYFPETTEQTRIPLSRIYNQDPQKAAKGPIKGMADIFHY